MRQAPALGCEQAVLQSPNLVLPETPLQQRYQPVFAVQTVGEPAQTSLAADMTLASPALAKTSSNLHPVGVPRFSRSSPARSAASTCAATVTCSGVAAAAMI
jgi:hypothetical protein